ncbi:hypothetical protein IFM89_019700 [Coptis chinensis]|uniref:Bulb-type lectin domain-containing protein n=1 Tax=Coptis chinensis TaxID=261450 RepID=A0A835GYE3_9MAGN|nr:hypothetical protein IFM89_019700 [Coptis chinensis]
MSSFLPFLLTVLFLLPSIALAIVINSKTFNYIIGGFSEGMLDEGNNMFYNDLPYKYHPFVLCISGTVSAYTFNGIGFTLALRLERRLVWQANRDKPVSENSTVTFGRNGNLVLANAQGQMVWQTNTANKGVVDLKVLSNGNLVLIDRRGSIVWQSFDHPTDSLLVGQSLLPGDKNKLTSRLSPFDNLRKGPYSLVMDGGRMLFYYQSKQSPEQEIYSQMQNINPESPGNILAKMTLQSEPVENEPYFFILKFNFTSIDSASTSTSPLGLELKFNTTYSYLQLGQDGNFRIYTYFDKVNDTTTRPPWDETFTMFSRRRFYESECQLPLRCGEFGVCEDNQCVACPTPKGLMGWSTRCAPPKLPPCSSQSGINVDYYKIVGVEHFSSNFSGNGPIKLLDCKAKCSKDCTCLGFFYRKTTSTCLLTPQLSTLTRVSNSSHLAFIKIAK